jgi:hypothetical protein
MLLTRENPLKPSGFCANRVTRPGYCKPAEFEIFIKITLLGLFFYLYYSKLDYLVITNKQKTLRDSKLLFLVYFSIFIIYLDIAILYFIIHFSITNYQCNVILAVLLNYEFEIYFCFYNFKTYLFILIILGVLIFNLIIYFMISQTWFYIFIYFLILYLNLRFDR